MKTTKLFALSFVIIFLAGLVFAGNVDNLNSVNSAQSLNVNEGISVSGISGDANNDGEITQEDIYFLIDCIFNSGECPLNLLLADANQDGAMNVGDAVYLVNYLSNQNNLIKESLEEGQISETQNLEEDLIKQSLNDQEISETQNLENSFVQNKDFIRGDANNDGVVDFLDAIFLLDYIFRFGDAPQELILGDANNDGAINVGDVVYIGRVLIKDLTSPVIKLISPDDEEVFKTSDSSKNINFKFEVSDDSPINYCQLIIDSDVEKTIYNVEKDVQITIKEELDRGDYNWKIKCVDIFGNEKISSSRDLEIKKTDSGSLTDSRFTYLSSTEKSTNPEVVEDTNEIITLTSDKHEAKVIFNYGIILLIVGILFLMVMIFILAFRR